jgi:alkaline phosphatase D
MKNYSITYICFVALTISNFITAETYKIAFGSCLDQDYPQPIWQSIKNENINSFIFLGDNVYGDVPSGKLNKMKKAYAHQKTMIPDWLFKKDVHVIWDDHDYGINDGGTSYPLKQQAQLMYLDFWNISSDDERRKREGIYTNKFINIDGFTVNLVLLDTRYFRSDLNKTIGINSVYKKNLDLNSTILGNKQWAWLEKTINKKADLVIISTSIQLLATSHRFEKWSNFPHEHIRMKKLLKQSKIPVLIVSGDRHQGAIYEEDNLFEITSSSLNKTLSPSKFIGRPKEVDDAMIGDMYSGENYGLITIDTEKKEYLIELKDLNGQKVRELLVPLNIN